MVKKICNVLSTVLVVVLVIIAAALVVPPVLGYQSMAVLSGSMEPEIKVGDIVYAKEMETDELKTGDIITYRLSGTTLVTHRIVEIDTENKWMITKGDANDVVDTSPVLYEQIVGRVDFHLPFLGYVSMYIKTPLGIAGICGVVFLMILFSFLPEVFTDKKSNKK